MPNLPTQTRHRFDGVDTAPLSGVTFHGAGVGDGTTAVRWSRGGSALECRRRRRARGEVGTERPGRVRPGRRRTHELLERLAAAVASAPLSPRRRSRRAPRRHGRPRQSESSRLGVEGGRRPTRPAPSPPHWSPPSSPRPAPGRRSLRRRDDPPTRPSSTWNSAAVRRPRLSHFAANGLSLGYSAGVAVGISMALPQRRVVNAGRRRLAPCTTPQALWNAAAPRRLPVLFVVLEQRRVPGAEDHRTPPDGWSVGQQHRDAGQPRRRSKTAVELRRARPGPARRGGRAGRHDPRSCARRSPAASSATAVSGRGRRRADLPRRSARMTITQCDATLEVARPAGRPRTPPCSSLRAPRRR